MFTAQERGYITSYCCFSSKWATYRKGDIGTLEKVQKRVTKERSSGTLKLPYK